MTGVGAGVPDSSGAVVGSSVGSAPVSSAVGAAVGGAVVAGAVVGAALGAPVGAADAAVDVGGAMVAPGVGLVVPLQATITSRMVARAGSRSREMLIDLLLLFVLSLSLRPWASS
jgi:hypothetical protein